MALRDVNAVAAPTAPVKVIVPVPPVKTKGWAPFKVELKVILALFEVIVLEPDPIKLTAREKTRGLAPLTVILLPIAIRLAFVNVRFVKGVTPPTAPVKVIVPPDPPFTVKALAPFNVFEKLIFAPVAESPPLVLSKVSGEEERVTGPVKAKAPLLEVILPPTLIAVAPV